jgi:hypothetical protein
MYLHIYIYPAPSGPQRGWLAISYNCYPARQTLLTSAELLPQPFLLSFLFNYKLWIRQSSLLVPLFGPPTSLENLPQSPARQEHPGQSSKRKWQVRTLKGSKRPKFAEASTPFQVRLHNPTVSLLFLPPTSKLHPSGASWKSVQLCWLCVLGTSGCETVFIPVQYLSSCRLGTPNVTFKTSSSFAKSYPIMASTWQSVHWWPCHQAAMARRKAPMAPGLNLGRCRIQSLPAHRIPSHWFLHQRGADQSDHSMHHWYKWIVTL